LPCRLICLAGLRRRDGWRRATSGSPDDQASIEDQSIYPVSRAKGQEEQVSHAIRGSGIKSYRATRHQARPYCRDAAGARWRNDCRIMTATEWQQHSVRGFLAGVVRKKLGLNLVSEPTDKGRVYRIKDGTASSAASNHAKQAA
jgi:hypothetical protein